MTVLFPGVTFQVVMEYFHSEVCEADVTLESLVCCCVRCAGLEACPPLAADKNSLFLNSDGLFLLLLFVVAVE